MEHIEHKAVWFPARTRVAGRWLAPPTLGQIRLLEAASSPFIAGGQTEGLDCAIALYVLRTPWRRARRMLARPRWLAVRLACMPRSARSHNAAYQISAFLDRALWMPDEFRKAGADGPAFAPSTGLAVRLALRAADLPLGALCHLQRGAWGCVWDVPVDAVLAYSVAQGEREGREFESRETVGSGQGAVGSEQGAASADPGVGSPESGVPARNFLLAQQQLDAHAEARDDQAGQHDHPQDAQHEFHAQSVPQDAGRGNAEAAP